MVNGKVFGNEWDINPATGEGIVVRVERKRKRYECSICHFVLLVSDFPNEDGYGLWTKRRVYCSKHPRALKNQKKRWKNLGKPI